jgi:putative endonuclease
LVCHSRVSGNPRRVEPISRAYYVYILASKKRGTLYIGVTADLLQRVSEHKNGAIDGFTKKYHVHILTYYEEYQYIEDAIHREKQLKRWNRDWKIELIEESNPGWKDLYFSFRQDCDGFPVKPGMTKR